MIYTTYFAKLRKLPETITPIAICGGLPKFYTGLSYKKLAPKWEFFKVWKETHDNNYYIENYDKLVLNDLSAKEVVKELRSMADTKDIVLVCYEKPSDFCHRHLVANWLKDNGFDCSEWQE